MSQQAQTKKLPPTVCLADLITEFVADTDAAAEARASGRPRGAITGLWQLDELLGGYLAPGVHVLQGSPGSGKTALALQIASDCVYPALFVSAEMGLLELFRRLIARQTKTFLGRLKTGEIKGDAARQLAISTAKNLQHLRIMDATNAYASPEVIIKMAKGMREHYQTEHILVILDSLHVWARSSVLAETDARLADEYSLINGALKGITEIRTNLICPVLTIAHRNREANKTKTGDNLHGAKGSGSIEYEAESVLDLNKVSENDSEGEKKVKASLPKNRNGAAGVYVDLVFNGALQSFHEL
jgi:replicative DNA helicase